MRFTKDHEYVNVTGNIATVGVSDYAQNQLGDVVYVELPEVGEIFAKGAPVAVVESVKAASDVYCPAAGEIVEVNTKLTNETSRINEDAEGRGWLFKIKLSDPKEVEALMDEAAYAEFLRTLA